MIKKARNNQFLKPIILSINSTQVIHFVILLGLLPFIADLSIFQINGISSFDFLFDNPLSYDGIDKKIVGAILGIIGLYFIYKEKKYLYILGLLPGFFYVSYEVLNLITFDNIKYLAIITSVFSKIAFVIFIIKGKLRSISFVIFTGILIVVTYKSNTKLDVGFFNSLKQSVLFVMFTIIARVLYLAFIQNKNTFLEIKKKRLSFLILKSILLWSPILLFAIPQQYITKKIEQEAENRLYATGYIREFYAKTDVTFNDLMETSVANIIQGYNNNEVTRSMIEGESIDAVILRNQADSIALLSKQNNLRKSFIYLKGKYFNNDSIPSVAKFDFNYIPNKFIEVYSLLQKNDARLLDEKDYIIMAYQSIMLKKIIINKRYPGKSGLELDAILSINDYISKDQERTNREIDSSNAAMNKGFNDSKNNANNELNAFINETNQLTNEIERENIKTKKELIEKTNSIDQKFKQALDTKLNSLKNESINVMTNAPTNVRTSLDAMLPNQLEDFVPYFKPESCGKPADMGWLDFLTSPEEIIKWIGCRIEEMVKSSQRRAYLEFRGNSLQKVEDETAKLLNKERQQMVSGKLDDIKNQGKGLSSSLSIGVNKVVVGGSEELDQASKDASLEVIKQTRLKGESLIHEIQEVQDSINAYNKFVKDEVNLHYEKVKELSEKSISATKKTIEINKLIGKLILTLLIFKSLFYVFSRVAFKEDENLKVTVANSPKDYTNGKIKKCGVSYSIPANHKETYFITRKFRPMGRAPKVGIHSWTASILKRIRTDTYLMNHVSIRKHTEETIDFRSMAGAEFIEWTLAEGEEVVFDYQYLVAITSDVELSSDVNFKLTATLFGKTIFNIAKGPGKLLLMSKGEPLVDDEHINRSVHIDRLVAWQKSAEFSVISELNIADMYLSGLYLKKTSSDLMVIDADETSKTRKVGIARFIGKFLIPN